MLDSQECDVHKSHIEPESLFKEQRSLMWMIQEMKDGVIVFDPEQRILLMNQPVRQQLRLSDSCLNQTAHEVLDSDELTDLLSRVLASEKSTTEELTLVRGRMTHYFQIHVVPLSITDSVDGCVAIFHDETAIRRTEKMRRDFVANVSHELRTPLSAIHGYAETLIEGAIEDKDTALDFVNVIFRHSKRLSQLVADLLDLSKLESPDFVPEFDILSLRPLIHKIHSLVESNAKGKELTLFIHLPDDLPDVRANRGNLEQVITNLVDNAIKYTPARGKIAVSAFATDNHMVQVNVTDTGIGIDSKHVARLFERFYRVDKARSRDMGGTGLGLSIVKHIIQYHGGDIWVESEPDKGSTFSFTLQQALPEEHDD